MRYHSTQLVLACALALAGAAVAQNEQPLFDQANKYYDEFTWDRAVDLFGKFVQANPNDERVPEAQFKILRATYKLRRVDDFEQRITDFSVSQRNTIWGARAQALRAHFLYDYRRWDHWEDIGAAYAEAVRQYRNAVGRRPFNLVEKQEICSILADAARFHTEWWDAKSRDKAKEYLESILQYNVDDETNAQAQLLLAVLYSRRYNDTPKYLATLARIVEEYDRTSVADNALYQLADYANQQAKYVDARQKYLDLRKRWPKSELEAQALQQVQEIERPVLGLGVSRTHLPGTTIPARLRARNIGGIDLTAYRLDPFELMAGGVLVRDIQALRPKGDKVGTWHVAVNDKGDYAWQELKFEPPLTKPGAYLLEAVAPGHAGLVQDSLINISSLVLVQQQANGKLVNYVASRSSVKPVEGVELRVGRLKNDGSVNLLKTGKTDGKGLWVTTLPPRKDEGYQLLAVGRRGDEWILQDRGLWSSWQEREVRLHGYLYTDRPVYRPGNQVHFRGILRNEKDDDYTNLPGQKVDVTINDPRGQEVYKATLETDAYGTIGGELALTAEPTLGVYSVQLSLPGGGGAGGQFRVEEYRKPEFKVEVGKPVAEVRPGGAAAVPVKAVYYFGAPVAGAELKYVVERRPFFHWYWFPGPWDWFYAGWRTPPRPWWNQQVVTEGKATTDDKGETIVEFATIADGNDYTYSVAVEVTDVTRRVVESSGSVTVTKDGFYLDAHTNQGLYAPKSLVTLQVHAQNADGQPVETAGTVTCYEMKLVAEKRNPQTGEVTAPAHYERGAKLWENKPFRTDPASGEKALSFTAPPDGHYELESRSPDTFDPKHDVVAKAFFWCASEAWKGRNYNHADLQLITEKDLYEKGGRARILINSPVPDASVLLTIGAHDILSATVTTLRGNSGVIELPIADAYAPNVFVVATLIGPDNVYFAQKEILVPPTSQLLNIKVEADKAEFRPRTQGTFHVTTTDQNGKPVPAQVSLGITDDSVYAIQEEMASPIGVFFYGSRRGLEIQSAVSLESWGEYGQHKDRMVRRNGRGGMGGGGMPGAPMADGAEMAPAPAAALGAAGPGMAGGARAEEKAKAEPDQNVSLREFFPDTILWQPTVITDGSGQATMTVEFPDSLTTWRATARAITKDTKVGQQVHNVVTTKDLIVRLQAPRFFTQLDQAVISLVVTNKTSHAQTVAVGLGVEGLELEGGNETVEVPPLGQKRIDRRVTATEPGEAVITVTAKGADDSDGVRQKFTVIPHGATKFAAKAGRIGAEAAAAFDLDLPADRRDDATKLDVTVSPTLAGTLLDALPYLVDYPYGCVEQTTSKFIPCVLVARTLEYTGKPAAGGKPAQVPDWWKKRGLDDLPDMVNAGIKRLSGMKNPDGGFGWFGGMRSDLWMTSYVVNGLMQARLADYTVPDDVLQPAIGFLYSNLHLLGDQHDSSAYVGWVLSEALANQVSTPGAEQKKALEDAFQRIYANRDDLNDYTGALLILGLHNRGEQEKAAVAWRNLQARRIETEHGVHWGQNAWGWRWSEDQVETTAFALQAALVMEPDSELTHKAVQWLVLNRTGNRWYSTKDTATALFALCRYAAQQKELSSTYTVTLTVNGQAVKGWEVTPQNALTLDGAVSVDAKLLHTGANRIELKRDGGSGCWYSAMMEFYSREDPIKGAGHYLKADRTYFKVTDYTDPADKTRKTKREALKPGEEVASGDQLEVDVTVDAENNFDYVCLADPKPAGCEPVDQLSGGDWNGAWMYREMHDREVTFFADHLPQGKTTLTYRLRAESPGIFRALPHRGFSMYRPDVRCLSDEAIVKIGEKAAG